MLELSRPGWLWLFALTALFFVAYLLARRYRRQRVTYGQVWHAVARRLRPPAWKRLLRLLLTLLVSLLLLASLVLHATGLQRPPGELEPPLMLAIALDCTPSMQARHGNQTRATLAWARARQVASALAPNQRALVVRFDGGTPLPGRWLEPGELPGVPPPVDFHHPDLLALSAVFGSIAPPPGLKGTPRRVILWLSDHAPELPRLDSPEPGTWFVAGRVPLVAETHGEPADNDGITSVRYLPGQPGDDHRGVLELTTRSGTPPLTVAGSSHWRLPRVTLPFTATAPEIVVRTAQTDTLPQDNELRIVPPKSTLARVGVDFPNSEPTGNPYLADTMRELLPGREVLPRARDVDLLVLDRVAVEPAGARALLCFGALPTSVGTTGEAVAVTPGLQRSENPPELGFEMPDLALLQSARAIPLADAPELRPLLRHANGATLIAEGTVAGTRVLYVGLVPHESNVLRDPGGILLVLRWLAAVQTPPVEFPPILNPGEVAELVLDAPATLELTATPWGETTGPRRLDVVPGPDGRAQIGPVQTPGTYVLRGQSGAVLAQFTALWRDDLEQALPYAALAPSAFGGTAQPRHSDWRDYLPALLLWLALGLLAIEWLLWLLGITD